MQKLRNFLLRHTLGAIVSSDVIRETKEGAIFLGSVKITEAEKAQLLAEAKAIEGMRLWHIMNETTKQLVLEKGWNTSTTLEHLNTAKTMYHTLDLQSSIIKTLKK